MSLICALSQEVPEVPVLNRASGHLYERRVVEKYIQENGKDPVTAVECTVDDLIDVKAPQPLRPRPPQATSIPGLLKLMQDEWDALMLETHTLKKQLHTTRQELSHALYQHDAACRVIARLTKERDAARTALSNVTLGAQAAGMAVDAGAEPMEGVETAKAAAGTDGAGIPDDALSAIMAKAQELSSVRKKRKKSDDLATREAVTEFTQTNSWSGLHTASTPGLTCLSLHPTYNNLVLTGGMDKKAVLFDTQSQKQVAAFKGHTKKVTDVILHPTKDVCVTASADSTVRVWSTTDAAAPLATYTKHTKDVVSADLHPTGTLLVTASADGTWCLSDLTSSRTYLQVPEPGNSAYGVARVHPDGLLLGTGSADGMVYIWDIKEAKNVADFAGHTGAVNSMAFSENGYYMATTAEDNTVRLWDLRMKKVLNFKTFEYDQGYGPRSVAFDYSGTYMATAGKDIRIHLVKQWDELAVLEQHTGPVTGVAWGPNASYLASTSMDRHLSFFGTKA